MEYVLTIIKWPSVGTRKLSETALFALRHLHDHFIPHHRNNYHPHILGHRALGLFSALLVSVKIFTLALVSFGPVVPAFSSAITSQNIISLTNQSRQNFQLQVLKENSVLAVAAQNKAEDMLAKGYFAHNTPDGKTPWDFINSAGYNYLMAGENLAVNFTESEQVDQAWMNSPGHKANILNKHYEEIGIGIAQGEYQGHAAIFVVQMFGTPVEQKITLTDVPTKVLTQDVPAPAVVPVSAVSASDDEPLSDLVANQEIAITDSEAVLEEGRVRISARISSPAVKAVAMFGQKGVMLDPKADGLWEGSIPLSSLAQGNVSVKIQAFDITGAIKQTQLADFSGSTPDNFNVLGAASDSGSKVKWLGRIFDPTAFEQKFYLLFVAGILASMIMAIAIRRHVQHLTLIANSSFVAIFAILLWFTG